MSTKEIVLNALLYPSENDGFVSGEKLAELCGTSRAAIWKAVRALKKDGHKVEAVTNRGYRLFEEADILTEETVRLALNAICMAADIRTPSDIKAQSSIREAKNIWRGNVSVYQVLDSTNTECKRRCAVLGAFRNHGGGLTEGGSKLHKSVVIACEQTAGRGRLGRNFYSPKDAGVYLSIIYSPEKGVTAPACMTVAAAVAVCRTLKKLYNADAKIKWVNDIFCNGKKVCGILTEGIADFESGVIEAAVIGIGVNLVESAEGFPDDISKVAGAVCDGEARRVSRSKVAASIISETISILDGGEEAFKGIMQEYRERSFLIGRKIEITRVIGDEGSKFAATVVGIDDRARLVVRDENGLETALSSGEVSMHY